MLYAEYLVLLGLLEQVRFAVNKNIIALEEHVARRWWPSKPNRAILCVDISRRLVRGSI